MIEPEFVTEHFAIKGGYMPQLVFVGIEPESLCDALELSIEKWYAVCVYYSDESRTVLSDGGPLTCGLCMRYCGADNPCYGCPIAYDGHFMCRETPYGDYVAAIRDGDFNRAKDAAFRELVYLESVCRRYGPASCDEKSFWRNRARAFVFEHNEETMAELREVAEQWGANND